MSEISPGTERNFMSDNCFLDTNILVYAHDSAENKKRERARELIRGLFKTGFGAISTQVLQEFYVTVTGKITTPLPASDALSAIDLYSQFYVARVDIPLVKRAANLQQKEQISFWDALIIAAAARSGCQTLYSEDLNHGQTYDTVKVINLFKNN